MNHIKYHEHYGMFKLFSFVQVIINSNKFSRSNKYLKVVYTAHRRLSFYTNLSTFILAT